MPNQGDSGRLVVRGFKFAGCELVLPEGTTKTVAELQREHNLPTSGVSYILNGCAIPEGQESSFSAGNGDDLEISRTSKGGAA